MYAWQMFYRRNRQMLFRAGAIGVVAVCATLALAPMPGSGADRSGIAKVRSSAFAMLLSPHRLETAAFSAEYLTIFR